MAWETTQEAGAPTKTSGERALDIAMAAGFEIRRHGPTSSGGGYYFHDLTAADGRRLSLHTGLGTGRFLKARASWPIDGGRYVVTSVRRLEAGLGAEK